MRSESLSDELYRCFRKFQAPRARMDCRSTIRLPHMLRLLSDIQGLHNPYWLVGQDERSIDATNRDVGRRRPGRRIEVRTYYEGVKALRYDA
jgi:hypothetical protein